MGCGCEHERSELANSPVILIMIDGLGIGEESPENPLTAFSPRVLRFFRGQLGPLPAQGAIFETRVEGGIDGRPQSATNHTSLFTGLNAPQLLGRHLSGFPNQTLREILGRHSIFRQLLDLGLRPTFANCYRPTFFQQRPRWVSASTVMAETAGLRLRTLVDLAAGHSVYMDITNSHLREQGYDIGLLSQSQAAQNLVSLVDRFDFVFYEYFLTDVAGHRGSLEDALLILRTLDDFLEATVERLPAGTSLLVTSDHGNLEKLDQRQHTHNPVATMVWGPLQNTFTARNLDISDLTPQIVQFLSEHQA